MDKTLEPPLRHQEDDYAKLRGDLVRAVARVCPGWLASRADDLVQVALLRVMEVRGKREGNTELSASYLRKVAYSALIDEIRRWRRRREVPLDSEDGGIDPAAEMGAGAPDPEERSTGREIGQAIRDCLARLVSPRRMAVVLHLQGHSVPEIGRLMGWDGKKADNLVYRGIAGLRECLESKGVRP